MSRLAIVVPASGSQAELDETLVSVLESRQPRSEVMLACDVTYEDPYDLDDEVTFVRLKLENKSPRRLRHTWPELANEALFRLRQPYVCLLMPGVAVTAHWAEAAIEILERHSQVGAVTPIVKNAGGRGSAGVAFTGSGRRIYLSWPDAERSIGFGCGPSYVAGVFRTKALRQVGGWNTRLHPGLADIDIALRLNKAGYRSEVAADSRVTVGSTADLSGGFRFARDAQRMYRDLSGCPAGLSSLHPLAITTEFFQHIGRCALSTLTGRLVGAYGQLCEAPAAFPMVRRAA